jgi:xanthine/CO dehydrogenase XdhC/CoxF family maturation factor
MLELLSLQKKFAEEQTPYVLATVVKVLGSASAKEGSKAVISREGKNLWGWVGGGCAESFTITQSLEALEERKTRTIIADLDDEVFGLGMPCGGKMEIFLEPILPKEKLFLPFSKSMKALCDHLGFELVSAEEKNLPLQKSILEIARAIALSRNLKDSEEKVRSAIANHQNLAPSKFSILGNSRITEELAKFAALLDWPTEVYGLEMNSENYPSKVKTQRALPDYADLNFSSGSFVIVASHHRGDHEYIQRALEAKARYVGMIASKKRANLVLDFLKSKSIKNLEKVQSPAGLTLNCRNPSEIALSVIAECLCLKG